MTSTLAMNKLKDFFHFSHREQTAILFLLLLIVGLVLFIRFNDRWTEKKQFSNLLNDSLVRKGNLFPEKEERPAYDTVFKSFNNIQPERSVSELLLNPFPFNPNKLPEETWRKIGLNERQIKTIKNYEAKGGKFYKKEDLAKIYNISKAEYAVLEPFINIPPLDSLPTGQNLSEKKRFTETQSPAEPIALKEPVAINQADSTMLVAIPGVSPWIAHRILKHRKALGGFVSTDQLLEISGIDSLRKQQMAVFLISDAENIVALKINRTTFKELLQHPYFDYAQTKAIFNHLDRKGFIRSADELKTIGNFTEQEIEKIKPYLSFL